MEIYIDDKKFYDSRYPMQNHWINQITKKWWENETIKDQKETIHRLQQEYYRKRI